MNGPEAVAVGVTYAKSENFEPQAKKQRLDNDGEQEIDFETSLASKSLRDQNEISNLCDGKEQVTAVTHDQIEPSNESTAIAGSEKKSLIKIMEESISEGNKSIVNGKQQLSNNMGDRKTQVFSDSKDMPTMKKEKPSFEEDDPFSALDWKDGIATLPGSNLKFKLTEFGTLEIISTVETEKGEIQWSTPTELRKTGSEKTNEKLRDGTRPDDEKDSGIPKKAKTAKNSSPNATDVLCCEVCGKHGLLQEFSASGRFCGLSCVGVYTGRRNKGREFVRKVKTADGKIVKKKKEGKRKENWNCGETTGGSWCA